MSDGEATGLQEVLHARDVLEMPPLSIAYEVVLQDLHLRLTGTGQDEMKTVLQQTIAALKAISTAGQSST